MSLFGLFHSKPRPKDERLARIEAQLEKLVALVTRLAREQGETVAVGQEILDAVTAQTTLVASVVAFIEGLGTDVVSPEQKAAILAVIADNTAALETAIGAGVVPPTP